MKSQEEVKSRPRGCGGTSTPAEGIAKAKALPGGQCGGRGGKRR